MSMFFQNADLPQDADVAVEFVIEDDAASHCLLLCGKGKRIL